VAAAAAAGEDSNGADTVIVTFLTLPPDGDDYNVRYNNLLHIRGADREVRSLTGFSGKTQWEVVTDTMCALKLPVKAMTISRKGKQV
jgi:hypothetical protein